MEPTMELQTATALFAVAAIGGLTMAGIRFSGRPRPPTWLAMFHGLLAAAGLTLLVYAALTVGVPPRAQLAAGLLVLAAVGGIVMNLVYHWQLRPLPIPLMLGHALLAVAGFVLSLQIPRLLVPRNLLHGITA